MSTLELNIESAISYLDNDANIEAALCHLAKASHIGTPGWDGLSKAEATRQANTLAKQIASFHSTMQSSAELAFNHDTFTNRFTAKIQAERFSELVEKYSAEFVDR